MSYLWIDRSRETGLMGFKLGRTNNRFGSILDALRGLRLRLVLLVACGIVPLTLLVGEILVHVVLHQCVLICP